MVAPTLPGESRVAVLVDCDNTSPEIHEFTLRVVAQFGRVVLRRVYGNHTTLANKWREANHPADIRFPLLWCAILVDEVAFVGNRSEYRDDGRLDAVSLPTMAESLFRKIRITCLLRLPRQNCLLGNATGCARYLANHALNSASSIPASIYQILRAASHRAPSALARSLSV